MSTAPAFVSLLILDIGLYIKMHEPMDDQNMVFFSTKTWDSLPAQVLVVKWS